MNVYDYFNRYLSIEEVDKILNKKFGKWGYIRITVLAYCKRIKTKDYENTKSRNRQRLRRYL